MAGPVTDYLATLAAPERKALERVGKAVLAVAPEAEEGVSYRMPAYKLGGKAIAGLMAFRDHMSYFPMSGRIVERFAGELEGFRTSRGTVQFTLAKQVPLPLLKRMVKARMEEAGLSGRGSRKGGPARKRAGSKRPAPRAGRKR